MKTLEKGYRGLHLLVDLNLDRFLMIGTLVAALMIGSLVQSLF